MKCIDCNSELPKIKEERKLKIDFDDSGTIFIDAKVIECPKCKSKYSYEEDATEIFNKIEESTKSRECLIKLVRKKIKRSEIK